MTQRDGCSIGVDGRGPKVVVVVKPGANPRRTGEIRRWIRALLPAALILVSAGPRDGEQPGVADDDAVTVGVDDADAGPLALAAALARTRPPR